jgi:hypothetical protein
MQCLIPISAELMHLSILIPGGKGAGNGWGFDKKIKNWVKCVGGAF